MRNLSFSSSPLVALLALTGALAAAVACSEDEGGGGSGPSGDDAGAGGSGSDGGGSGGSATGGGSAAGGSAAGGSTGDSGAGDCSVTLPPGSNASDALLGALIDAESGDVICLAAGTHEFTKEVTHTGTSNITIRGVGATRNDVILDFSGQTEGDNAMEVDADHFTIEDLTVIDAKGDGVKVTNSDYPTFRNVKATWSAGASSANGTYALYPAECSNVLIEDCEVSYAADAGIYLGQSTKGIVRRNVAFGNVIGIEAENSDGVELYDNEAYDNTCGMLIVNLPNLVKKNNLNINAHDNIVRDNNHVNFALPGAFVEGVPQGSGVVVMASDDVEVHENTISDNDGVGIIVVSWPTFSTVGGFTTTDTEYEQYVERVNVHDNTYTNNGAAPGGVYGLLFGTTGFDVAYDGAVDPATGDAGAQADLMCIREAAGTTYYNMAAPPSTADGGTGSSDLTPHDCSFPAQPTVTF